MTPRKPLFRKEILEARRSTWLGSISLVQPVSLVVLSAFALATIVVILLFLAFGEYTRRSRVGGQLIPSLGMSSITAPANGIVGKLYSAEGGRVELEAPLAMIAVPRVAASGGDAREAARLGNETRRKSAELDLRSQNDLLDAQQQGHAKRLMVARRELGQIEEEISTRQKQLALSTSILSRYQGLAADRYVSSIQVEQQQQAVLEQQAGIQILQRQYSSMQRSVAEIEQVLGELPARRGVQLSQAQKDLSLLGQERVREEAEGATLVRSPVAGVVASRLVEPGQSVQAGQVMLTLLPRGSKLQAQLLVPSRAAGFIEPGDRVLLRYQSFPYQKFGHHEGTVLRVSRNALSQHELESVGARSEGNEPMYRVIVDLRNQAITAYGKEEPLRPGMLLEADILGEHRKLYEWVLEPLYAVSGKLGR